MKEGPLVIGAVVVVALVAGYFIYQGFTQGVDTLPKAVEQGSPLKQTVWAFDPAGTDESDAPLTAVSVVWNGKTYEAGTEQGNCFAIEGSNWELVPGEESGAICWWAGGGTELGIFEENGEKVVKRGQLEEGSAEEPGLRGTFTTLFVLKDNSNSVLLKTGIGKGEGGFGVRITPLSVIEDSRCPTDVQCIQAGTVRVNARVDSGSSSTESIFTLGVVETRENVTITLVAVEPAPVSTTKIQSGEYRFTFGVEKRTEPQ